MIKKIILLSVVLLAIISFIFLLRIYSYSPKKGSSPSRITKVDEGFFEGKNTEVKQDIDGKDIRLRFFWIEDNEYIINDEVITMLTDQTVEELDSGATKSQTRIIKSWIWSVAVHPKMFISDDKKYLVFQSHPEISIYNFDEKVLINSLIETVPGIEGTNLVRLDENSIILGLFEGRGGVCEEDVFSVNLDTFEVIQLTPRPEMERC